MGEIKHSAELAEELRQDILSCVEQVDQILQQADESAAKGNLEGSATITSLY